MFFSHSSDIPLMVDTWWTQESIHYQLIILKHSQTHRHRCEGFDTLLSLCRGAPFQVFVGACVCSDILSKPNEVLWMIREWQIAVKGAMLFYIIHLKLSVGEKLMKDC